MALTGTKGLLVWCQRATEGYNDVKVVNMTTSFRDGLAFCAIIHHFRPDLINFSSLAKENIWENNQLAFEVAENELNIPALLDPDDMVALSVPDKLSIMTYVSQYYNCLKNKKGAVELGIKSTAGVGRTTVKRPIEEINPFKDKEVTPAKKSLPANSCQVCAKKVYLVEKVVSNGKLYHRSCFKCNKCGDTLRPGTAKFGSDPSKIECRHHQDKIWNLRSNMSNRTKQPEKVKGGSESIWETQGTPKTTPQGSPLPWAKNQDVVRPATPPPSKKPPIPANLPSKVIHPHLDSKSSARAQFFTSTPDKEAKEKSKESLITSLAGVMARDEGKMNLGTNLQQAKSKSKETLIDEPVKLESTTKPSVTPSQKTDSKPSMPASKPVEAKKATGAPTSVSERIGMFSQNNNQADLKMKEPQKKEEKQIQKKAEPEPEKMKDDIADTQPIVSGKGGVQEMISRMEHENNDDDKVSGEGSGEALDGSEGGSDEGMRKDSGEKEKQDTEKLEKENELNKEKSQKVVHVNGTKEDDEELDEDNPFFGSDDEEAMDVQEEKKIETIDDSKIETDVKAGLDKQGDGEKIGTVGDDSGKGSETEDLEGEKDGESLVTQIDELKKVDGSEDIGVKDSAIEEERDRKDEKTDDAIIIADKKSETSKDSDLDYDDSLNPFGSEDDKETSSDKESDSELGPNNPFAVSDEEEEEGKNYDESLNPFGTDDEITDDSRVNPFTGSPVSDTSFELSPKPKPPRPPPPKMSSVKKSVPKFKTREEIIQEMQRARDTLKQKKRRAPGAPQDSPSSIERTPSPGQSGIKAPPRSRKSRRAPLPPGVANGSVQHDDSSGESPVPTPRRIYGTPDGSPASSPRISQKVSRPGFKPPPQPQSRMSKRRAPEPPPQKRDVSQHHVTPAEIQREIAEIDAKTSQLERKGILLEDKLRAEMQDDASEESEELLMEWFEVVNEKNQLVRREGELVAQAQIQELEIQHAEVEYDLRCLMHKQEHEKTDEDSKKEEELLELLVGLVQQRSTIVDRLEEDRIREQEEDETIRNMMQMKGKLLHPEQGLDRDSVETKKEKKKRKKKKKHKEKDKSTEKEKHKDKSKDKGHDQ